MTEAINKGAGFRGFQDDNTASSEFNAQAFVITQIMGRISTCTLVKVMGVTNDGGLSAVGFVDILPLVNQIDGAGNAFPHGTIFRCPYMRLQGGANAVILDPQVGDLGLALFADRDISSVTANKGQANPGSRRRFDMADGLYIGGVLNGVPTQFMQFSAAGIKIQSDTDIKLEAPSVEINATGAVAITSATLKHNGINIGSTHTHGGVTTGGGSTAVPNP